MKANKGFFIVSIVAVIAVLGVFAFFVIKRSEGQIKVPAITDLSGEKRNNSSRSPFPFEELTIPFLRNRQYKSSLRNLEKVSENAAYTSYLASYDSDGLKINGLLTRPMGEMPQGGWPAIVFVHGYIPPAQYRTLSNYSSYVDYLAKNGFVVFKIDLRGHAESEGEPGGAYYSSDYLIDTLNAKAALESSDFVKRGAVGLWGHSMAGNVIFRAFAVDRQIPAIVIWAGAVYSYRDFFELGISDNSYHPPSETSERARKRRELFEKYGQFDEASDFWKLVPATNYLADTSGSVQVHHASDDAVVDIGYSGNLMQILNGTNIGHELFVYQSGGHNLTGAAFDTAMQRTADFFNSRLRK